MRALPVALASLLVALAALAVSLGVGRARVSSGPRALAARAPGTSDGELSRLAERVEELAARLERLERAPTLSPGNAGRAAADGLTADEVRGLRAALASLGNGAGDSTPRGEPAVGAEGFEAQVLAVIEDRERREREEREARRREAALTRIEERVAEWRSSWGSRLRSPPRCSRS